MNTPNSFDDSVNEQVSNDEKLLASLNEILEKYEIEDYTNVNIDGAFFGIGPLISIEPLPEELEKQLVGDIRQSLKSINFVGLYAILFNRTGSEPFRYIGSIQQEIENI